MSRWAARALLLALALGALAAGACSRAGGEREPDATADLWLAEAAARHRAADVLLERGETAAARKQLSSLLASGDPARTDGARQVLQDTYYRLARLDLDGGDARGALARVEHGLRLAQPPDLFVANLLVVRGAAHEALGDARAAADDYHRALVINDQLLHQEIDRP